MTFLGIWEVISTAVVTVAAVTMLTLYLHDRQRVASPSDVAPTSADDWRDWGESGIRMGSDGATMVIATFSDFSCPFCRDLVPVLDSLGAEYPGKVAIEHHHFPLKRHEFAVPSAIAAECADRQGRFDEMYYTLFLQMDSIGLKSWDGLAADAGIPDMTRFQQCIRSSEEGFPRIAAGRSLGARIGVRSTPTIWINGQLFQGERSLAALRRRAKELGL